MDLRIVCLSDTHDLHDRLAVPDGDVLVHAGDFTGRGSPAEVEAFGAFLARLPHREKIVVAGNHDFLFEREPDRARELLGDVTYLLDSGVRVGGLAFWGSPWQPWFHDWAFNLRRGAPLAAKWALVPDETDVLVTHGPPMGVLDLTFHGRMVGCEALETALARIRPRLHVFGHIHEAYGTHRANGILSVNASNCDLRYRPVQPPVVVDWDGEEMRVASGGRV
jgi:predicted phosphodiesterase